MARRAFRISAVLVLTLALGAGAGCGSVLSKSDGGGSGGSGGSGVGGRSGSGGAGGGGGIHADGGVSCSDLANQYAAALPLALRCDLGVSGGCQQLVSQTLSESYCGLGCEKIYVNDASTLNALEAAAQQARCNTEIACPALACAPPTSGGCVPADGGGGVCSSVSASSPTPTN
jgi:hypothetical protein